MAIQLVLATDRTAVGRLLSMSKFTDMSFCFIEDHRKGYSVRLMCDVFEVSPAGYYAWRERAVGERATANARLLAEEIRRVPQESGKRYSKSAGPCRVVQGHDTHPGEAEEDAVSPWASRRCSRRGSVRQGSLDQLQHGRRRGKCEPNGYWGRTRLDQFAKTI